MHAFLRRDRVPVPPTRVPLPKGTEPACRDGRGDGGGPSLGLTASRTQQHPECGRRWAGCSFQGRPSPATDLIRLFSGPIPKLPPLECDASFKVLTSPWLMVSLSGSASLQRIMNGVRVAPGCQQGLPGPASLPHLPAAEGDARIGARALRHKATPDH